MLKDKTISATDKLVALANQNSVITQALQQQNTISLDRFTVRQQLSLAQDVEVGRIVSPGVRDEDGRREQPHRRRDRRPDRPDRRDPRGAALGSAHGPPPAEA